MKLNLFNKADNTNKNLLNVNNNDELFAAITTLQNEINVGFDTKVIAVTSIKNDALAAAFGKALSDAYVKNESSALIIDANMYNPQLEGLLELGDASKSDLVVEDGSVVGGYKLFNLSPKNAVVCIDKQVYPGVAYKNKAIHKIIKDNEKSYEHFIVLVPSIKDHKELVLLSDVVDAVVLVTKRSATKKQHIFDAVRFCELNKLPLAKTVVIK